MGRAIEGLCTQVRKRVGCCRRIRRLPRLTQTLPVAEPAYSLGAGAAAMARRRAGELPDLRWGPGLQLGAQVPEFGEQLHFQHAFQIADAAGAAGTAFEADHSFHGGHMVDPPAAEVSLEID